MKVDRSWYQSAVEKSSTDERTSRALDRNIEIRQSEIHSKLRQAAEVKAARSSKKPKLEKQYTVDEFARITSWETSTVRGWCRDGVIAAIWQRGQWRIPESAAIEFLEKENRKHG